jgi:hypothetical protein
VDPLVLVLQKHIEILKTRPSEEVFGKHAASLNAYLAKVDASMRPLAAAARLLPADLIYCRFAPTDFSKLHELVRKLVIRANGRKLYLLTGKGVLRFRSRDATLFHAD